MYLKNLEIQGFKSFADKISIDFNSGITSIVGPNGSGKSNISDAVRWVLGEQRARTLRGSKMEDVIFAGTEHRKPHGFAEVSMIIDNSDNRLPISYNEVTITRRAYRSGESEYFINKVPCRLKDIHELFLDTGIGRDGYSIISQGRIDEILSVKSEDRRHIFEEASGIMKYKIRKIEAERKLESTTQNLIRINDIISELELQLEPLRQQSETARKYLDIREKLKNLEVNVYIENIAKLNEKVKELDEQYEKIRENVRDENAKLEEISRLNHEKSEYLKSLDEKLSESRTEYYNLEGELERCNSQIKLNNEKIKNYEQNNERLTLEIEDVFKSVKLLNDDEQEKNKKIKYLNEKKEEYSAILAKLEEKMNLVIQQMDENEKYVEKLKADIMDKLDAQSDKKAQANNVKTHIGALKKRQMAIDDEINSLKLDIDKEGMKKEEIEEGIKQTKETINSLRTQIEKAQTDKRSKSAMLEELRKKQSEIRSDIKFKTARYNMLKDMEKNFEGYNRSVKAILQACAHDSNLGRGIHGALAQLIKVDGRYENAIEAALGGSLQNIVTTTEEDAKRIIDYLKKNRLGRATFLPISSVKSRTFETSPEREIRVMKGFCGIASELVGYNPEYRGVIENLLGKVVVADNLDSAIAIARKYKYSFKIVTIDGDILSPGGSMTGGSSDNRGPHILGRNREIEKLKNDISELERKDSEIENEVSELVSGLEKFDDYIRQSESSLKENEIIKIRDENHLASIEETITRYKTKIDMLEQEKEQLSRQEEEAEKELLKYLGELEAIEKSITNSKSIIEDYQERHKDDRIMKDNLSGEIMDYKISVNSICESIDSVNEALARIENQKKSLANSADRKDKEKQRNQKEIENLHQKINELTESIRKMEQEKSGKMFEIDRISEEKRILEEETANTINRINDINKNIILLQEELGRLQMKKTKFEVEIDNLQNRMWDEYELTYTNALEYKKDIGSIAQAQKLINQYRAEIKALGAVNVSAIDEYVKTRERYEFMTAQRNDMENAKEKLHKIIKEIETHMKQQFMEQFKKINENFGAVFKELFDGGYAKLKLSDENDILESGIEIEVQPPGKKLQNMMLLSGGERAFTAIALLFAILRLNPAPFCILDEIEAALDEANVARFAQYLKKYADETQFIVITHRKGTMEISDTLYGVTMQERGISKIVSIKMDEKAS